MCLQDRPKEHYGYLSRPNHRTMRTLTLIIACILFTAPALMAQSKSDLQATITGLTAKNDSLTKQLASATDQNKKYSQLIDTLSVMTGVHVNDLDTVKSVLELRATARTANTDSLTQARSGAAKLQLTVDSLSAEVTRLRNDSTQLSQSLATAGSDAPAQGTLSTTDQLMKLDGMLQQGLLTREEFLKMKGELLAK
jgi:hypothetical protein